MQVNKTSNWILLRGLTRESGHWGNFVQKLSEAFPHARIYPLDLPGTGIFYKEKSPDNVPAITEHIRLCARQNGWLETPVNLLGVSLGGMVALNWLQTHPAEINSGVLINVSAAGFNRFYQRLRWQSIPDLLKVIKPADIYDRELAIIKLISNCTNGYADLAEQWSRIQTDRPVNAGNALSQLKAAASYCPLNITPVMPVLLLNSAGDRLVEPACTDAIARQWNLPYQTHPWGGHDLTTDDGDWVIVQLQNWFRSIGVF